MICDPHEYVFFKNQNMQMFGLKLSKLGNFHSLEVVGRGSDLFFALLLWRLNVD